MIDKQSRNLDKRGPKILLFCNKLYQLIKLRIKFFQKYKFNPNKLFCKIQTNSIKG